MRQKGRQQQILPERDWKRVVRRVVRGYSPEKIIMFGSCARGDVHEGSDIDLVIIKNTEDDYLKRIDKVLDCCTGDYAVEPFVYTEDEVKRMLSRGNDFLATALEEGIVVYEKSE